MIDLTKTKKNSVCFMAVGSSRDSSGTLEIKNYIGIGSVKVLAVNPNKAELEKLYGRQLEKEPEYLGKSEINGTEFPQVRINFIVKTDPDAIVNSKIDMTTNLNFFLRKTYRFNKDQTKVQVIDKYGRTAWVTKEQCQTHEIPVYSNGPARIDKDYRPCYDGEEDLTNFIRNYLNISDVDRYVDGAWKMASNPDDCECRLDFIENYFKGDFAELKTLAKIRPNNNVKILFGVRSASDGRQYQGFYSQMALRGFSNNYLRLEKDLKDRKANGAYANTEFEICDLKEYKVIATDFSKKDEPIADDPFGAPMSNPWEAF